MYAAVPRIIPTPVIIAGVVSVGDIDTLEDLERLQQEDQ